MMRWKLAGLMTIASVIVVFPGFSSAQEVNRAERARQSSEQAEMRGLAHA